MKRSRLGLAGTGIVTAGVAALLVGLAGARAEGSDQVYFVGWAAPLDGALVPGDASAGVTGVFLWWDALEGELPADVARLELVRDGTVEPLPTVPYGTVAPAALINQFYGDCAANWRCLEQARTLCVVEKAQNAGGAPPAPCTAGEVAAYVADIGTAVNRQLTLAADAGAETARRRLAVAWSRLASRHDVNVARARGHAFIDTEVGGVGPVRYYLRAVQDEASGGATVSLGEIEVVPSVVQVLPRADNAVQVPPSQLAACDAPEAGLGHGVIALSWDHPTASLGRLFRFLRDLSISGYDVHRRRGGCAGVDADTLHQQRTHDPATGASRLPGFERQNETPVAIAPPGTGAQSVQFLQEWPKLEKAGLRIGDVVCYAIVARDLSGAYGRAALVEATVPDVLPPPAPWNAEAIPVSRATADEGTYTEDDELFVQWDAVDVTNYVRHVRHDFVICNADSARDDRRVKIAPTVEGCSGDDATTIPLAVREYRIYRFESEVLASQFEDPDGDGYGPASDRAANGRSPCTPDGAPAAGSEPDDYVAPVVISAQTPMTLPGGIESRILDLGGGRKIIRFVDPAPEAARGKVFWYRIAAVGAGDGSVSALSPPIRAAFPVDEKPPRPSEDLPFGTCTPQARAGFGDVEGPHGIDYTGRATTLRLTCGGRLPDEGDPEGEGEQYGPFYPGGPTLDAFALAMLRRASGAIIEIPLLAERKAARRVGFIDAAECEAVIGPRIREIGDHCELTAEFLDARGEVIARASFDDAPILLRMVLAGECGLRAELQEDCIEQLQPVEPGAVVDGDLNLRFDDLPVGSCAEVNQDIGGVLTQLLRVCNDGTGVPTGKITLPNLGGGFHCLEVTYTGKNNILSTPRMLPCVQTQPDNILPPRLESLAFDVGGPGEKAALRWLRPAQPTAGILVEATRRDDSGFFTEFMIADNSLRPDQQQLGEIDLGAAPAPGTSQRWCLRARSVGVAKGKDGQVTSDWTAPICGVRSQDPIPPPSYFEWPQVPLPGELGTKLPVRWSAAHGVPAVLVGKVPEELFASSAFYSGVCADDSECVGDLPSCLNGRCAPADCSAAGDARCFHRGPLVFRGLDACGTFHKGIGTPGRFVVYRQERSAAGAAPSDFAQVSPRIDGVGCERLVVPADDPDPFLHRHCGRTPCDIYDDPFVQLARFDGDGEGWPQFSLVYVDEYPFVLGHQYRYQLVYFDDRGEIAGVRNTDWVEAQP